MMERKIIYFENVGPGNTDATLDASKERARSLNICKVVVATTSGDTALKCATVFKGTGVEPIAVTLAAGRWKDLGAPNPQKLQQFRELGGKVVTATQVFIGSLGMAIRKRFGGLTDSELIGQTLYCLSQGVKVAVEIAVMAADAGLVTPQEEIISIAGTDQGADTALVVVPAYSNEFFDFQVKEIIAMPR
ncbi:hypothetical protein GTO10_05150 [Candidatus Saccharibacteria bacterium]|nr:hypothetical protein [Candidatus Saccharibacteria bacterium]